MNPSHRPLPPDLQSLLVLVARLALRPDGQRRFHDRIFSLDAPAWARLAQGASDYRVSGFLLKHLAEQGLADRIPDALLRGLKEQSRRLVVRGLKSYNQLTRIVDAASSAGIDLLLLKGAYLARWIYRDLALRPFNDFDLLCRPADVSSMAGLLQKLGYVQDVAVAHSRIHARLMDAARPHAAPFDQPEWPRIEVHTALTVSHLEKSYPQEVVWNRAVPLDWEGRRAFRLSFEDQIVHLALHLLRHLSFGLMKLFWLSDIHEFVLASGASADWDRAARIGAALGAEEQLAGLWRLLAAEWGTPVPARLLSPARPGDRQGTLSWLFSQSGSAAADRSLRKAYLGVLRLNRRIPSWPEKLTFLWKQLLPDRAYIRCRYKIEPGRGLLPWYIRHLRRGIRPFLPRILARRNSDKSD